MVDERQSRLASTQLDRRQILKLGGIGAGSALALPLLAACNSGGSGAGSTKATNIPAAIDLKGAKVAALYTALNNDYYSNWDKGARAAVEAFGGKYVGLTNGGNAATELTQFQQQVQNGTKIIFITAPDSSNVPAMAKLAQTNKVYLVNTWEMPPWESPFIYGDYYVSYLCPPGVDIAYQVATALFKKMGGSGNFVHLTGHPGSTPDSQRTAGVDKALKDFPNIKLVARQAGDWDRDTSNKVMTGIISRVGVNNIGGVFGQNDDVGVGALNALKQAGSSKLPPITGIDGNASTIQLIKAGEYYGSYSGLPVWNSGFSFVLGLDASKGWKPGPLDRQLSTGGLFVTAANADQYLKTYTDPSSFDWVKMSRVAHPKDWDPQNQVAAMDMNAQWSWAPKPAGYTVPAEYADAQSTLPTVNAEWASHWKLLKR